MGDGVKCQHHTLTRPFCALAQQRQTVALKTPNPVRVRVGQGRARRPLAHISPHTAHWPLALVARPCDRFRVSGPNNINSLKQAAS